MVKAAHLAHSIILFRELRFLVFHSEKPCHAERSEASQGSPL